MERKYRAGIIGFGHMHVNDVAEHFLHNPRIEWAACADTVPVIPELNDNAPYTRKWNMNHALTKLGIPKSYEDYREMLKKEKFDIIIVTSENARHAEIVEACAEAGVNVCVEKPMAMDLAHALRMVRAAKAAGILLMVNWPSTWSPELRKIKELLDTGVIGKILEFKFRSGHTGPLGPGAAHKGVSETAAPMTGPERGSTWWHQQEAGGGATLDYCCYGAMLSRWLIGEQAVSAVGMIANLDSQWGNADDNGAMIIRFPNAMALLEASWTTFDHGIPSGPIIYGTEGTLVQDMDEVTRRPRIRVEKGHGQREVFLSEPLPAGRRDIAEEFVHCMDTGNPVHDTLRMDFNLEAMAILDAGMRSALSGRQELVNNFSWKIG